MGDSIHQRWELQAEAIAEILEESGPLTPAEIAFLLEQRGWSYWQMANGVKDALHSLLNGRVRQVEGGRWCLLPIAKKSE